MTHRQIIYLLTTTNWENNMQYLISLLCFITVSQAYGMKEEKASIIPSQLLTFDAASSSTDEIISGSGWLSSIKWNPKRNMLASCGYKSIKVFNHTNDEKIASLKQKNVRNIEWDHTGTKIIANSDHAVKFWDIHTKKKLRSFKYDRFISITSLASHPKKPIVAMSDTNNIVTLFRTDTHEQIATFKCANPCVSVAWHPKDPILALSHSDSSITLLNTTTLKEIATLESSEKYAEERVWNIAWHPDGTTLASYCNSHQFINIWDTTTHKKIDQLVEDGFVESIAWRPDGTMLFSRAKRDTITLWDVATREKIASIKTHPHSFAENMACHPDGKTLASCTYNDTFASNSTIKLLKISTKNTKKNQDAWEKEE